MAACGTKVDFGTPIGFSPSHRLGSAAGAVPPPFTTASGMLPYLKSGALQRVLPDWYSDQGVISLYFTSQKLLPAKTRAFVDHITEAFREQKLSMRFSANE
jgi:DNA-binding transcriptional LysR family regulator